MRLSARLCSTSTSGDGKGPTGTSVDGIPIFFSEGIPLCGVECKGGLKWDDVGDFPEYQRYEDAVSGSSDEVLLIPEKPKGRDEFQRI